MARPQKSRREHVPTSDPLSHDIDGDSPIDPRAFGLVKAPYCVSETLDLLSVGRSTLYAAIKRGELRRVKFGKKTLFYAADLAAFLAKLRQLSGAGTNRDDHGP
jgi:excisionase family DNA binding protein